MKLPYNALTLVLAIAFLSMQWSSAHIHLAQHHDHDGSHHQHASQGHSHSLTQSHTFESVTAPSSHHGDAIDVQAHSQADLNHDSVVEIGEECTLTASLCLDVPLALISWLDDLNLNTAKVAQLSFPQFNVSQCAWLSYSHVRSRAPPANTA